MAAVKVDAELVRFVAGMADHMPGMIGYWDANLLCRFANQAYLDWFGRTPGELIGTSIRALMGEELFAKNQDYIIGALAGQRQSFERTLTKSSGEIGQTWAQYIPDTADDGTVRGFYVLVTDVTELRRTTHALETANADLEIARKEAEAANEAKGYFLANMSHEIRTPLTSIIGFSALLSDGKTSPEEVAYFAAQISTASQGLLSLVNDILDHMKLEAGRVALDVLPCDISGLVRDVVEMMTVQIAGKPLEVAIDCIGAIPENLMLDEAHVRQILQNLIGNAVKFTHRGVIRISVEYIYARSILLISVQDTGKGISEDGQKQLFQRFSQVDRHLGDKPAGTGLGLMICRQLLDIMGGEITVESRIGEGSTFRIEIPAEKCVSEKGFEVVATQT